MLVGREAECARLDRALESARRGRSSVLVVRGEAGMGKTSLLRYAIDRTEAMAVVRATGVESEAELEFSGLLELCRPLLEHVGELPELQASALRGAVGLEPAGQHDRFAIGAATLSLIATAAERQPLLVVVDDVHWLDRPSADALRFAARRLLADKVAVIVATRLEEDGEDLMPGAEEIVLAPLRLEDARSLVEDAVGHTIPAAVLERLHAATRGNPLALVELPEVLTPGQLLGREPLEEPLPAGAGVERAFAGRAERLPVETRRALLLLALATVDRLEIVARALSSQGLGADALRPAEDARLVEVEDGRVRFRHPLVRSAVTRSGSPSDRRAAHRALASAFETDEDRRAWHLAAAAFGPDEEAASALAAAGARASGRSGFGPAAAAFERAALLTPEEPARLERLADAGEAAWRAGATEHAIALLDEALARSREPRLRARLLHLRGRLEVFTGSHDVAQAMLLEGGALVEQVDPALAATLLGDAVEPCFYGGRVGDGLGAAERARALAPRDGTFVDAHADYWLARALAAAGRGEEAAERYGRLLEILDAVPDVSRRWALVLRSIVLGMLDRPTEGYGVATEAVSVARQEGPTGLASALAQVSWNGVRAGHWHRAVSAATEGLVLARELAQTIHVVDFLCDLTRIEAGRADVEACRAHAAEVDELAGRHGLAIVREQTRTSLGLLELGLGRPEEALTHLEPAARGLARLGFHDRDLAPEPDVVEALTRLGRLEEARAALGPAVARVGGASPAWGAAIGARLRGLVADEDEFELEFRRALSLHERADDAFARARTELAFGERLRRAGHRRDARVQLRAALKTFDELGASPWSERASTELRASGETLRRRQPHEAEELTPQELQIALLVAEGKTNKEVGAALFLSHKTVEFHLGRIYRKLSIGSRAELIRQFAAGEALVPAG
jgi:DNA-binding CsgD family transcriptional regulator